MSTISDAASERIPKTSRGRKTRAKLLEAAAVEFGERGFHEASISSITERAKTGLGTFYVYFESKDEIFRALVAEMGRLTRAWISERVADAPDRLTAERLGVEAFLDFVRTHRDLYRIIMEAQFVSEEAYRDYYSSFAEAYQRNLAAATKAGDIRPGDDEERAWALIGMSVFLGQRYVIWDDKRSPAEIAASVMDLIEHGLAPASVPPGAKS